MLRLIIVVVKTVYVVGASGFVGSNLVNHLRKRHRVIAGYHQHLLKIDGVSQSLYLLTDRDYMKRVFTLYQPDVIIYCAGVNSFVDCARWPKLADAVNTFGPVLISSALDQIEARFVYLSSAFVYDGRHGNFLESDVNIASTAFGKTKSAGENYARSKFISSTILRLSPMIGLGSIFHLSMFDKIRMKLARKERVELPENEVHSFLLIDTALKAIEWVIENETVNRTYNLGGLTKLSWYEYGVSLAESFGFDPSLVIPAQGNFEGRVDFSLNSSEFVKQLEFETLPLEQSFDLLKQQMIRR